MAARPTPRARQRKDVIGMDYRVGGHGAKVSGFTEQNEGVRVCRVRKKLGVEAERSFGNRSHGDSLDSSANGLTSSLLRICAFWGTLFRKGSPILLVSWDF